MKFYADLATSQEDLNTFADTRAARMPQSRVNSDPCLYTAQLSVGGGGLEMPQNSEGLTFDLFKTVTTLRKLKAFLEPVGVSFRLAKSLTGGKIRSLLCGILLNVLFLTLSEGVWLLLGLLGLVALAILGFLKRGPRSTPIGHRSTPIGHRSTPIGPALRRQGPYSTSMEDLRGPHTSRQELAQELKTLLWELDEMLSPACLSAESAYSLLFWGNCSDSALFYGALLAVLCLLHMAPGSYTLVVTNSAFFLWKGELHRVVRNIFWKRSTKETTEECFEDPGDANISWEDLYEIEDLDVEYAFKDAIEDEGDDYGMPTIIRRGALVGVIPNLHQKGHKRARRPRLPSSGNSGNCSRCRTSFSVLKKKKNCSNCGSSFCMRCCCKVQRSCLDTSAPEDQNEFVLVCTLCSMSLTKQE